MHNSCFLRWDTDAQSTGNLHITEYRDAFYRLKNLTNAKFEFNSLLGLAGQIHLLVLHPERIKKQNRVTSSKQYNLPHQQTVQFVQGLFINKLKIFQYKAWSTITREKYMAICMAMHIYLVPLVSTV